MTREELARRVGVNPKTISNWERGAATPKTKLGAVERALGIQLRQSGRPREGVLLAEATDAQVLADVARRLADRDDAIRKYEAQLSELRALANGSPPRQMPARWAARARETDEGAG